MRRTWSARVALLALACAGPQPAPPPLPAVAFSGKSAFAHLGLLVSIGPRVSGTPGAAAARGYLRDALGQLGVPVGGQSTEIDFPLPTGRVRFENVIGTIPGASPDLVVLAAPYDSQPTQGSVFLGANDGASGAALLLELARVLGERPLPYTVLLAFLDGESPRRPDQSLMEGLTGSRLLARELSRAGSLERVRIAVYLNRVADENLVVARDLYSQRRYRDAFFDAAARMGHGDLFPTQQAQGRPVAGHRAFLELDMRRAVAIVDERSPAADGGPDDLSHCSARSLGVVGAVTEVALRGLAESWLKLDRYGSRPAAADPAPAESPAVPLPDAASPTAPGEPAP
jgi:hypothetical protein